MYVSGMYKHTPYIRQFIRNLGSSWDTPTCLEFSKYVVLNFPKLDHVRTTIYATNKATKYLDTVTKRLYRTR